jgi:nucleoside-diphosphate-sugar epimerase
MKKTILFGGSGFLGHIFLKEYSDIISVGRNHPTQFGSEIKNTHIHIPDMDSLHLLDDVEFENVIFLVGNSNHHKINSSGMMGMDYNVIPLKKILHYLKGRKIKKFVCFTSILLYGDEPKGRPVNEQDEIFPYQNEYVFSKYLAEQVVEFYKKDIPIINIRLCNIYGDTSLIRPDLVPTLIKDVLTKENPTVWNMKPKRDFIFTTDAAEAIVKLLDTDFTGTINLGSGNMTSIEDITNIIERISGKKINSLNNDVDGVMEFVADISLLKSLTGWRPKHSLKDGFEKTYNTMKENLKKSNNKINDTI